MFGGLFATGITKIGHHAGLNAWRYVSVDPVMLSTLTRNSWLYIIEGLISILAVGWVWFGLPDDPLNAKWWTPEEKQCMEARRAQHQQYLGSLVFEWAEIGRAFKDPKVYTT
jgi:hypothetical protein